MYSTDGELYVPQSQTDYVVPTKEVKKENIFQACKEYILDSWDKKYFEKERGITIDEMLNKSKLNIAYERYIPINENSFDYDIWGSGTYRLYPDGGRGATKVWVLEFTDDPFSKSKKEVN